MRTNLQGTSAQDSLETWQIRFFVPGIFQKGANAGALGLGTSQMRRMYGIFTYICPAFKPKVGEIAGSRLYELQHSNK